MPSVQTVVPSFSPEPILSVSPVLSLLQALEAGQDAPLLQTVEAALGQCLFRSRPDTPDAPDVMTHADDAGRRQYAFFVVLTGRARILREGADGSQVTLERLAPGQFFAARAYAYAGAGDILARMSQEGRILCLSEEKGERKKEKGAGSSGDMVSLQDNNLASVPSAAFDDGTLAALTTAHPELRALLEQRAQEIAALLAAQTAQAFAPNAAPATQSDTQPAPGFAPPLPSSGPDFPVAPDNAPDTIGNRKSNRKNRKCPALLQVSETDCGAACLAMLLRYYGKHVSINRLRALANVGVDGATLRSVAQAAQTLGFQTRAVKTGYEQLLQGGGSELPAIVHWQGFHFIVLYEVRPGGVVVADPAIGLRRLSREEFVKGWTGYTLFCAPTAKIQSVAESTPTLRQYLPLLAPFRRILVDILLASLLLQLFGLATPIFTQYVVDKVLVHQNASMLNVLLVGMLLVAGFQALAVALRQYLMVHTARRLHLQMVVAFYQHMLRLPMRFFEDRRVGDMLKRFNENARIREILTGRAIAVIVDCMMIVVYLALMVFYNLKLSILAAAFVPLYGLLLLVASPILRRQQREAFEKAAEAEALMVETVQGIGTVKATNAEGPFRWQWQSLMVRSLNVQFRNALSNMNIFAAASVIQTLNTVLLLWYGARLVIAGELTVGQLVAFNVLAATITRPILNLIDLWNDFQEFGVALERLNDIFDAVPEEDENRAGLRHLPPLDGRITFEDVTFRYPSRPDTNVLQNIRLEIKPGQTVALVGRSGAGKTTFANLLLRLHEPTSGRILMDGVDIKNAILSSLRGQVGVVMQDNFLFSGTIRDNIACGDVGANFDAVVGAAMLAGAHEFVQSLPLGYETKIGEHGQGLSGGQRQRVAIARALYKNPRVLIMDEATSALDTESERAIQRNLDSILKGRTTLLIAHRLSTVRNADLIVVLDQGCIVETGSHDELMRQEGLYFYLNGQQMSA